jgi:hypothetical protein
VINVIFLFELPTAVLGLGILFKALIRGLPTWFHERLTPAFASVLRAFTEFGSSAWIAIVLSALVLFFVWKHGGNRS